MSPKQTVSEALVSYLDPIISKEDPPQLIMLSGAQGIGKSTALRKLKEVYCDQLIVLSLDDFYLSRAERTALAKKVHPLCATRGPPGTHDLELLTDTLNSILSGKRSDKVCIPVFSKRDDDRSSYKQICVQEAPRTVLLEGWLLGAEPDPQAGKSDPINALEADCDGDGVWRDWQEHHLAASYAALWEQADQFCHLVAPSFENVLDWRLQQEAETISCNLTALPPEQLDWVVRFIAHYERVTKRMIGGSMRDGMKMRVSEERWVLSCSY